MSFAVVTVKSRKSRGRPRRDGARHPGGQLVQKVEPNAKVMQIRRALMGEETASPERLASAEDPMSLALARGWISEAQHRAGLLYAACWRRSHPQRRASGLQEIAEPASRDTRPVAQLSDAEIADAFEAILAKSAAAPLSEAEQVEARTRYNAMSRLMTRDEQAEVFLCFCLGSWPQWIVQRCAGRWDTPWERKQRLLASGLATLAAKRGRARAP